MAYELLREGCRSLDRMIATGRSCRVICDGCGAFADIDLQQLRDRVGGDYSLLNRRCRCRLTKECTGWNRFFVLQGAYVPLWDDSGKARWMAQDWDKRMGR